MTKAAQATPVIVQVHLADRARLTEQSALAIQLTVKAIRRKIDDGKWIEGREYFRDPDGNIWLNFKGIMRWVAPVPA